MALLIVLLQHLELLLLARSGETSETQRSGTNGQKDGAFTTDCRDLTNKDNVSMMEWPIVEGIGRPTLWKETGIYCNISAGKEHPAGCTSLMVCGHPLSLSLKPGTWDTSLCGNMSKTVLAIVRLFWPTHISISESPILNSWTTVRSASSPAASCDHCNKSSTTSILLDEWPRRVRTLWIIGGVGIIFEKWVKV